MLAEKLSFLFPQVEVVRKGAIQQAEVLLAMSEQFQSLCVAQTNLAEVLPLEPIVDSELHISGMLGNRNLSLDPMSSFPFPPPLLFLLYLQVHALL